MSSNERKGRMYTVETMKLAMKLAEVEGASQILKVLASAIYGTASSVAAKDLLNCLAEVLGPIQAKELEKMIEGEEVR